MQFNITLRCLDENPILPINYQYELSAWIYKVIQHADADYSAFLHRQGHQTPARKSFKLFCFSQLDAPRRRVEGDRLLIQCGEISFLIGFYLDRTAEEFVRGLFSAQQFSLGDRVSRARFVVQSVEMRPPQLPGGSAPVRIRALSPLVIARKRPNGEPDEYLHPDDPDFGRLLFLNLLEKYRAATGEEPPGWWNTERFGFRIAGAAPRSKLVAIKAGTAAQTKVKGYLFDFEVDAPGELVELGLLAGFGRENALGFGCGVVVRQPEKFAGARRGGEISSAGRGRSKF